MITIALMKASGLSSDQILNLLELEQNERLAKEREQNRIRQRNHRARNDVTRDKRDTLSPPIPPSMVSPITPSLTPSLFPSIPLLVGGKNATRPTYDKKFEEFWKAYPRRQGSNPKFPAGKRFLSALKAGTDPEDIIAGARNFAADPSTRVGTEFVPRADTWLNQKCWQDYSAAHSNVVTFGHWIGMDTAEWDAWSRHRGKPFSLDKRGGWTAPSQWPPGFKLKMEAAE